MGKPLSAAQPSILYPIARCLRRIMYSRDPSICPGSGRQSRRDAGGAARPCYPGAAASARLLCGEVSGGARSVQGGEYIVHPKRVGPFRAFPGCTEPSFPSSCPRPAVTYLKSLRAAQDPFWELPETCSKKRVLPLPVFLCGFQTSSFSRG